MRILVLFFTLLPLLSIAQQNLPCVDSNRVNPFYICPTAGQFIPVCGCDGNTYRNECIAFNVHGVNRILHDGVCTNDLFFFDFWPNLTSNGFTIHLLQAKPHSQAIQVRIIDSFGKQKFVRLLQDVPNDMNTQINVDTGAYEPGVYFVFVIGADIAQVKKFVKMKDG